MTSLIGGIVEYWSANKDPLGSQFPLVQGGPWALLAIMAFFAIIVIFVGPVFMRNRKLGRIRPYLVVYNGFMFGVNGTGFIVTLILSDFGYNAWDCKAGSPRWPDFRNRAIIYLGYTYMLIKMISFGRIILDVLTKKPVIRTLFNLAHMSMVILLLHCGMYFYPGGVFCYLPLTDTISSAIVYGYMMLKSVKTTGENLPSKQVVLWSQVVHYVLLLAHAVRFLTEPECAPVMVTAFQAIYATVSLIFVFAMHQADLFSKVEKVKST